MGSGTAHLRTRRRAIPSCRLLLRCTRRRGVAFFLLATTLFFSSPPDHISDTAHQHRAVWRCCFGGSGVLFAAAAAATSAPASSVPPPRPGVRQPGGLGHDLGGDDGGGPSMGTNLDVGDREVGWGEGREGGEVAEAPPPPPPPPLADGDRVTTTGGAGEEGGVDGAGREAVNYGSIALALRMACETNRRLGRASKENRRLPPPPSSVVDAGNGDLQRHPFVGATRLQQQGQQQGQATQQVPQNIHPQQPHRQQHHQLHHPPPPYGSAPPPPQPLEGQQQHQHQPPPLLPPPPVFRIVRSSRELPNAPPPPKLTVFHAGEPRRPIVKKKKKKRRNKKADNNKEGEEEQQQEETDVIIQRRGVERWGPSLPTFLSQLVEALDCPPICLAVAIIYVDRSTSVDTVRQFGVDPCPYVEPRTVHRLVLTALVLACRAVGDGGGGAATSSTGATTAYYADRLRRFGVGARQLAAMESAMLDALGAESTAVHPSRVEGLIRAWSATFVSPPVSGSGSSSTAATEEASAPSYGTPAAAEDPRNGGETKDGIHPPASPPGGGLG